MNRSNSNGNTLRPRLRAKAVITMLLLSAFAFAPGALAANLGDTTTDGGGLQEETGLKPDLIAATFQDLDTNGRFDHVQLHFAIDTSHSNNDGEDDDREPVVETIRPQDFTVAGHKIKGCVATVDNPGIDCDKSYEDHDADGDTDPLFTVTLILEEALTYETGRTLPAVSYTPGTLVDLDGDAMPADSSVIEIDAAAPVFTAAYGQAGDGSFKTHFTEPLVNIDETLDGDTAIDGDDVCYTDAGGGAPNDQQVDSASHASGVITVTVTGVGGLDEDALSASDINGGASVGFGNRDKLGGADCGEIALEDSAGNGLPSSATVTREISDISVSNDFVAGVFTNVGSNKAWVVFNGPVSSPSGGALAHPGVFQYVNDDDGGATGIVSITHTAGSNIVQLNLQGVVDDQDVDATADFINIIGGKVAATGDSDNLIENTASYDLDDASAPSAAASSAGFANLDFNRLTVYPVGAVTVDNNRNGVIDAVLVQFSGTVDPTTFGTPANNWTISELTDGGTDETLAAVEDVVVSGAGACSAPSVDYPAILNAIYVCIDEAGAFGTDTVLLVGSDATLEDVGGQAIEPFARVIAVDSARPVLTSYHTLDADDDGQIDRLVLTYSEPIDDSTFLASEFSIVDVGEDDAIGGGDDTTYTVASTLDTAIAKTELANTVNERVYDDVADDEVIYLQLTERGEPDTDVVPTMVFARGGGLSDLDGIAVSNFDMTDLVADEQSHPIAFDGALPVIVSAHSQQGTTSALLTFSEPVYGTGAGGKLVFGNFVWNNNNGAGASGVNAVEHAGGDDTATITIDAPLSATDFSDDQLTFDLLEVNDGTSNAVPPAAQATNHGDQVFIGLTTLAGPTITSVKTLDLTGPTAGVPNGWLDGLEITFSENVDDFAGTACSSATNMDPNEWSISLGGRTINVGSSDGMVLSTFRTDFNGDCDTADPGESGTFGGVDDNKIYIFFDGDLDLDINVAPDGWRTDQLPKVTYAPDSTAGFIRSLADGAPMAAISGVASTDGAGPVLLTVSGSEGSDRATLTFSEGVTGTGAGGKVRHQDFTYHNVQAGGASSIATVEHTAGTSTVTLTFNADLNADDFADDEIAPKTSVKDAASVSAPVLRIGFADASAPILEKVETVDDGNGLVDHLRLTFSEPLDDGVGCGNIEFTTPGEPWTVKLGATTVTPFAILTAIGDDGNCAGAGANDAQLYIQLTETTTLHGGVKPTVSYNVNSDNALIVDQASPANALGAISNLEAMDKVAPVLWDADGAPDNQAEAATQDLDGDGKIDAYRLIFSEPVLDSSFRSQEWLVDDASNGDSHLIDSSDLGTANDSTLRIPFSEGTEFDGAETPQLFYTNIIGFTDLAGNELASLAGGDITEVDRARPTVVGLATGAGLTIAQIEFSEPVARDQAQTQALLPSDFDYVNGNGAGAGGLASVNVAAGGVEGTVTFDQAVTAGDLELDTLSPVTNAITDAAGNYANFAALSLNGELADRTPPGQITNLAVEAGEQSLKLTWTTPVADDLDEFDIRISEAAITEANFAAATKVTAGTIGDVAILPVPSSGASQTLTVTGLDATKTYFVAMTTKDVNGLVSDVSNSPSGQPLVLDNITPGGINDLSVTDVTANSITLSWTAPGDDDATGTVSSYDVKISENPITATNFDAAADAEVTFSPATLVAGGATQAATVTKIGSADLDPETLYYVAVRGVDEKDQKGGIDTASAETEMLDDTPPTGTLVITSSTHQAGVATETDDATFSWTGLTDAESQITYYVIFDDDEDTTVTAANADVSKGTATTHTETNIAPGTWYLHVVGISQGGSSLTAHYEIVVEAPPAVDFTSKLKAANEDIRETINVERANGDNTVSWTLPDTEDEIAGVQIWRSTSPFDMIADLAAGTAAFAANSYTDEDAPAEAVYLVTVYFLAGETGGQYDDLDNVPGYSDLSEDEQKALGTAQTGGDGGDDGVPGWVWFLIGGLILLIVVIVLIVVLARRNKDDGPEDSWDDEPWDTDADTADGDNWDDDGFDDGGWDEPAAAEAESYQMECPDCEHVFTATGVKPLTTTCPQCGVKGVLN